MRDNFIPNRSEAKKRRATNQYMMIKEMEQSTRKNFNARAWFDAMPYGMEDKRYSQGEKDGENR